MEAPNFVMIFWALVIIGGPILLFLALNWSKFKTQKQDMEIDDGRAKDDPSKGMGPTV